MILWRIKSGHRWWIGGLATVLVVSSFSLPIFKSIQKDKQKVVVKNEKYLAAKAVFDERCKDAGYKIYKTVEDVEGVTLLNVWPEEKRKEDQMWEFRFAQCICEVEMLILKAFAMERMGLSIK